MAKVGYDTLRGDWTVEWALLTEWQSNNDYALGSELWRRALAAVYGAKTI